MPLFCHVPVVVCANKTITLLCSVHCIIVCQHKAACFYCKVPQWGFPINFDLRMYMYSVYWMGSRPMSLGIGQVCAVFRQVRRTNTSKTIPMSSGFRQLPIQWEIYCYISYTPPVVLNDLLIKLSNITGYWTACHNIRNTAEWTCECDYKKCWECCDCEFAEGLGIPSSSHKFKALNLLKITILNSPVSSAYTANY